MARWSDLPVELKEATIGHLGKSEDVKEGKRDSVDFQALLALSQVERAAYLIARPYLWKRIDISNRSKKSIEQFADSVLPSTRPFITRVACYRRDARGRDAEQDRLDTMLSCASLVSLVPTVQSLSLGVGKWSTVLPSATLANLEELCIEETDETYRKALDNVDSLELVQQCPNLRSLTCHAYHTERLQKLYDAIRSLEHLRRVTLWDAYGSAEDHLRNYLAGPWTGTLTHFSTNMLVDETVLQELVSSVGTTLQSLTMSKVPHLPSDSIPLQLPRLVILSLAHFNFDGDPEAVDLQAFNDSPLQVVKLFYDVTWSNPLGSLREFIQHHRSTLICLHVDRGEIWDGDEEMRDEIHQLCLESGIAITWCD